MMLNKNIRLHHGCDHENRHNYSSEHINKDEKILKILLSHQVNYNETHEEGFREWVDKARTIGKNETANNIEKAIEYMEKANKMLLEAKKNL